MTDAEWDEIPPLIPPGKRLSLLFELVAMVLVREKPAPASRIIEDTDNRLWRIVHQ